MRALAVMVGLLVVSAGLLILVTPETFLPVARAFATPTGLYGAAVIRVGIGLILWRASAVSRAPAALRAIGIIVVIFGVATPLVGADRARAILNWWVDQGLGPTRVVGGLILLFGGLIGYAFIPDRRAA